MKSPQLDPSFFLISIFFGLLMYPATGWPSDEERGIRVEADRQIVLVGLKGDVQTVNPTGIVQERSLNFGDTIQYGDCIQTATASRAEILIGQQEVVTLEGSTSARLQPPKNGISRLELEQGAARVAASAEYLGPTEQFSLLTGEMVAQTKGGVFHVNIADKEVEIGQSPPKIQNAKKILIAHPPREILAKATKTVVEYLVEEGTLTLIGTNQSVLVNAGQSVKVVNGIIEAPTANSNTTRTFVPLTAVSAHQKTPKAGIEFLATQEMRQAEVLGNVLSAAPKQQTKEIKERENSEKEVVLATTGLALSGGDTFPTNLPPNGNLFPVSQEVGGPTGSLLDPVSNSVFNLALGAEIDIPKPKGGGGLLLFNNSHVTLDASINNGNQQILINYPPLNTELMLIDGGSPSLAPHQGQAPTERVSVTNLVFGTGGPPPDLTNPNPGRNLFLPFQFAPNPPDDGSRAHVLTRFSDPADETLAINVLEGFASSVNVVPGSGIESILFPQANFNNDTTEGVHGVIRARDLPGETPVELAGGVVLNNNTDIVATTTKATENYFQQQNDIEGSILAILGRNFDVVLEDQPPIDQAGIPDFIEIVPEGAGGGELNPAHVKIKDRVLGVLDGSTIIPETSNPKISLLTILDSRLEGPTEPPALIPGDSQPVAPVNEPSIPLGKSRADIPPLVEIINSGTPNLKTTNSAFQNAVEAHSAAVIRGDLAPSILEASGPLVSLFQGTMATSGDFVNVQGNGTADSAQLMASLQQSNVLQGAVQLNNSQLQVGGHLFNLLNGATGQVTGNLTALANDSILDVNGALVAVGLNSSFTLTGGSLVAFGFGTNMVNITGTSGTCAGCNLSTTVPNLSGIPVLLHPSANVSVGPGFVPYAGVGQGNIGGLDFNNTVNVSAGAAVLQVDQGGTLVLNP